MKGETSLRLVAYTGLTSLGAVALYAVLAVSVLHGEVDSDSLARSLEQEVGAGDHIYADIDYGCHRESGRRPRVWTCVVPNADSGVVDYRVEVQRGASCWTAIIASSDAEAGAGMPKRAGGCVRRWEVGWF